MISGSYRPEDVTLLLKPIELESTDVKEKEQLIQTGRRHYSEMITREALPSQEYLDTFYRAYHSEKSRFARHLLCLANLIAQQRTGDIVLVSLARAGTPVGVLLQRILTRFIDRRSTHYSISIIRDRGIDSNALRYILTHHGPQSVVFVDGWTGKGVIARELQSAVRQYNEEHGVDLDNRLYAVADLCGAAKVCATTDDYLIPSSVLGATISGLVSRSILKEEVIGPEDFHGCLYYKEFESADLSRWFADGMTEECQRLWNSQSFASEEPPTISQLNRLRIKSEAFLTNIMERFGIRHINHIKPGIGESTRVLLRRVPHCLLLRDPTVAEVSHLRLLANEKGVPVLIDPQLPYLATALIRELN